MAGTSPYRQRRLLSGYSDEAGEGKPSDPSQGTITTIAIRNEKNRRRLQAAFGGCHGVSHDDGGQAPGTFRIRAWSPRSRGSRSRSRRIQPAVVVAAGVGAAVAGLDRRGRRWRGRGGGVMRPALMSPGPGPAGLSAAGVGAVERGVEDIEEPGCDSLAGAHRRLVDRHARRRRRPENSPP